MASLTIAPSMSMDSVREIERCAADWLARRESDRWSKEDQAQLDAWLGASTANMVEFLRLEAAWEAANRLQALGAGVKPGLVPTLDDWRASPFFKHAPRLLGRRSSASQSENQRK